METRFGSNPDLGAEDVPNPDFKKSGLSKVWVEHRKMCPTQTCFGKCSTQTLLSLGWAHLPVLNPDLILKNFETFKLHPE